jgi:hypothetical protein
VADLVAGADRDGRLHDEDRVAVELRQLVDDGPDAREVGVARVGRRRVDADEQEVAADDVVDVEREGEAIAVPLEQLRDVGLVERNLAGAQPLDLLRHDVANHDVVAEVREARARDETDPAGAEDPHACHFAQPSLPLLKEDGVTAAWPVTPPEAA